MRYGSNSPVDPTEDEPLELPDPATVIAYAAQLPDQLLKWFTLNLQRLVNQHGLDTYQLNKAMPALVNINAMLEDWARRHMIHNKNDDLKAMRYWWGLFMHLYGPQEMKKA